MLEAQNHSLPMVSIHCMHRKRFQCCSLLPITPLLLLVPVVYVSNSLSQVLDLIYDSHSYWWYLHWFMHSVRVLCAVWLGLIIKPIIACINPCFSQWSSRKNSNLFMGFTLRSKTQILVSFSKTPKKPLVFLKQAQFFYGKILYWHTIGSDRITYYN